MHHGGSLAFCVFLLINISGHLVHECFTTKSVDFISLQKGERQGRGWHVLLGFCPSIVLDHASLEGDFGMKVPWDFIKVLDGKTGFNFFAVEILMIAGVCSL